MSRYGKELFRSDALLAKVMIKMIMKLHKLKRFEARIFLDNIYKSRLDGLHESIRLYKLRTVSQQLAAAHPELSATEIFQLAKKQVDENHE